MGGGVGRVYYVVVVFEIRSYFCVGEEVGKVSWCREVFESRYFIFKGEEGVVNIEFFKFLLIRRGFLFEGYYI